MQQLTIFKNEFMDKLQFSLLYFLENYGFYLLLIILLIIFDIMILKRLVRYLMRIITRLDFYGSKEIRKKLELKMKTLEGLIVTAGNLVVSFVIILIILKMFNIDAGPVLAGAGIIGLILGFGTQSLIKDFVSGVFIIIENQYNRGDYVKIGVFEGSVKKITIRSTILSDKDGNIIYLANGTITNVINYSQGTKK